MQRNPVAGAALGVGLRLIEALRSGCPRQNLLVAPPAVIGALALLANSAEGQTLEGILQTLGLPGMSLDSLNQAFADLLEGIEASLARPSPVYPSGKSAEPAVTIEMASGLWGNAHLRFHPDYVRRCREFYHAQVGAVDFGSPDAAEQINAWVRRTTHSKIPEAIGDLGSNWALVLISAVFFQGAWSVPFDPRETRAAPFHLLDGTARPHPLMRQSGDFQYTSNRHFAVVRLPFGPGSFSMIILLPHKLMDPARLLAALSPDVLRAVVRSLRRREGTVALPRCAIRCEAELAPTLSALGMEVAFDPVRAELSPMLAGQPMAGLALGSARHKTLLEINERGAAAVATMEATIDLCFKEDEPFTMIADRPFACVIHESVTSTVLFLGAVVDPA
jgi:serpin B